MMYVDTNFPTVSSFTPYDPALIWILVASFIIAFFLAFGVGANDVANSFGTSVGSKVLTLRQACILATIFEVLGAVLLGYNVSETIRTGMIYIEQYEAKEKLLMMGYMAALCGSALWNLIATCFGLPISGTHSIVGAIIGFSVVAIDFNSVKWDGLIRIVMSWFISPIMSGVISLLLFLFIRWFIISRDEPIKPGVATLPFFYGFTIFVNIFSIVSGGPHIFKDIPWWVAMLVALALGFIVGLGVWFIAVPRLKKAIEEFKNHTNILNSIGNGHTNLHSSDVVGIENGVFNEEKPKVLRSASFVEALKEDKLSNGTMKPSKLSLDLTNYVTEKEMKFENGTITTTNNNVDFDEDLDDDKPEVAKLFTFLQILTACFASFAHGANDVSNAIGPLVAVMMIYREGNQNGETPWYILLYGGIAISIGLWVLGRKVIKTMGQDLTKITPSTGFTIEVGAAITVLLASKIGVPVSTTHCKVGSVVMVGKARGSKQGVNWRLFANIAMAWILTVPLSAAFAALAMFLLKQFAL